MKQRILKALLDAYETYVEEEIRIVKSARKEDPSISRRVTIMLDDFLLHALSSDPSAFPPDIHKAYNDKLQAAFAKYDITAEELLENMAKWTKQLPSYRKRLIEGVNTTMCSPRPEKNRLFFELI